MTELLQNQDRFKQITLWLLPLILGGCMNNAISVSTEIGVVTSSEGYPSVIRNNQSYILDRESRIFANDVVDTDEQSKLQIRMIDNTILSMGHGSHVVLHRYWKMPDAVRLEGTFTKGAIRATRDTQNIEVEIVFKTPLATIQSISEDFWAGFIDRTLDVALFNGSSVIVRNRSGEREVVERNHGIKVNIGSGPQEPILWYDSRIEVAKAKTIVE
ncbi:MAG TPA: hypothetical protein DCM54_06335 [Gammaproteobacteria bacterium]|nr:hypothetical protein [Gammaproteobacteria bacterium]